MGLFSGHKVEIFSDPIRSYPPLIIFKAWTSTGHYRHKYLWLDETGTLRVADEFPHDFNHDGQPLEGGSGGQSYPQVETYADLPPADEHPGEIYIVRTSTGIWFINRKNAGLWRSNGANWVRLGDYPQLSDMSMPNSGDYKITNIYIDNQQRLVVEYDDTPV